MKAMLSQPMAGKTDEEIVATREKAIQSLEEKGYEILTLPMPKGRGFSVLPSQPCICKVLYKVPERSVRACPALP